MRQPSWDWPILSDRSLEPEPGVWVSLQFLLHLAVMGLLVPN